MLRWFFKQREPLPTDRLMEAELAAAYSVGFLDGQSSVIQALSLPIVPSNRSMMNWGHKYRILAAKNGFRAAALQTQGRA